MSKDILSNNLKQASSALLVARSNYLHPDTISSQITNIQNKAKKASKRPVTQSELLKKSIMSKIAQFVALYLVAAAGAIAIHFLLNIFTGYILARVLLFCWFFVSVAYFNYYRFTSLYPALKRYSAFTIVIILTTIILKVLF